MQPDDAAPPSGKLKTVRQTDSLGLGTMKPVVADSGLLDRARKPPPAHPPRDVDFVEGLKRDLDRVNREIAAIQSAERNAVIQEVQTLVRRAQQLVSEHGLTSKELNLKIYQRAGVKYSDVAGNTWDGRLHRG